ncbi:MAG: hypothetical protein IJ165_06245 [Proteobacteria bacterium]|nr:hypothetical protein [Pseudomonadota bacterium]
MNLQTQKTSGKKQPKQRRSLKKRTPEPLSNAQGLVLDMDKGKLENIFVGLSTGQLENPQVALSRLYGLALDSLAGTLIDSLDKACTHISTNDTAHEIAGDTPFEPILRKILPSDPQKIQAFKTSLSQKIDEAKNRITAAYATVAEDGPDRLSEQSRRTAAEIESLLHKVSDETSNIHAAHPLSSERLSQIYDQIQSPVYESGPRKYTISNLPNAWRFSIGNNKTSVRSDPNGNISISTSLNTKDTDTPAANAQTEDHLTTNPDELSDASCTAAEASPLEQSSAHLADASDAQASDDANTLKTDTTQDQPLPENRLFKTSDLPIPQEIHPEDLARLMPEMNTEVLGALAEGAEDVFSMATEVTSTLQAIALEIAHAAMTAYQEDEALARTLPSLAQRIQEDTDLPQDEDLLSFVQTLESQEDLPETDTLSNDELADAFGQLLAQFDLDD